MKMYKISYRKDEWVSVIAGFEDGVNVENLDHVSLAKTAAVDEDLTRYEIVDSYFVSEISLEVNEIGEGVPDVVISSDGSLMSGEKYERIKVLNCTDDVIDNFNQPTI